MKQLSVHTPAGGAEVLVVDVVVVLPFTWPDSGVVAARVVVVVLVVAAVITVTRRLTEEEE